LAALIVGAATNAIVQVPVVVMVQVPETAVSLVVPAIVTLVTVPLPAPAVLICVQVPFSQAPKCPLV